MPQDPRSSTGLIVSLLIPAIFILIGVALFFLSGHLTAKSIHLKNNGFHTNGRVIDVQKKRTKDSDGNYTTSYIATIQYHASTGVRYETQKNGNYPVGSELKLIYDPQNPKHVERFSFAGLWAAPIMTMVFSVIFGGIGIFIAYKILIRRREIEWLFKYGTRIRAKVIGVKETEGTQSRRGRRRYSRRYRYFEVICEPLDGRYGARRFVSDRNTHNPGSDCIGREVEVIINQTNPDIYFVNLYSY